MKRFLDETPRRWKIMFAILAIYSCYVAYLIYWTFSAASMKS
ncbi:hypothetical protein [Cupriavidus pauculus]|nr:hypothetical protein [Cupriavidus pauculus]